MIRVDKYLVDEGYFENRNRASVAIKTGDVNASATANSLSSNERTINGQFDFQVEDVEMKTGNTYTVAFTSADIASIEGYQMTLALAGVELVDIEYGVVAEKNFGLSFIDKGLITTSWNQSMNSKATADDVLFSLVLHALEDGYLSNAIQVSNRYTMAEAYRNENLMNVGIHFTNAVSEKATFELFQNTPNPFKAATMIGFNLPTDAKVTIKINDISGRELYVLHKDAKAGYNQVRINKQMINGTTGVLSYTISTTGLFETKTMIVVK